MTKAKLSIVTPAAIALALLLFTNTAGAVPFQAVMDEFWIVKNSSEIFRDSFSDGFLPPNGPDGANTYGGLATSAPALTSEAGGKLTMTPSLGDPTILNSAINTGVFASRLSSTSSASPNFLGQTSAFSVHGLFDLANLPDTGDSFGISLIDDFGGSVGNDTVRVRLTRTTSGNIVVQFQDIDFVLLTSTLIASSTILPSILSSASQIELVLSKDANSTAVGASYVVYNATHNQIDANSFAPGPTIYNGENFTRAQFLSTDREAVPEPASFALLGLGLAGLGWSRRRK